VDRRTLLLAGLAIPGAGFAHQEPQGESGLFRRAIKNPTGRNGYEEFLAAGDALRSSHLFDQAQLASPCPLALKRRVFRDPPVIRALALLRRGLGKPVFLPHEEADVTPPFPDYAVFRQLARLIMMQQQVAFAEGRILEAIELMHTVLALGRAVQVGEIISGLVGIAVAAIGTAVVAAQLGQLAAQECEALLHVCLEDLAQPDLLPEVVEGERRSEKPLFRWMLDSTVRHPAEPPSPDDDPAERALDQDLRQALATEASRAALEAAINRRIDDLSDRCLAEAVRPPWERRPVTMPTDNSVAGRLVAPFVKTFGQTFGAVRDKYAEAEARVRLLACHAAIRRYLWEHDRLPANLADLGLGDIALDPFTGQPLQYRVSGRTYEVASAGPVVDADDPRAVDGRRPVDVVPKP
jgi:hypothetical protein